MSGRWWRAYNRARHDPKLLKLSDRHFRWWFNLVCVAADNDGVLQSHADLAVEFRTSATAMTQALDALVTAGLLEHDEAGIRPHNWNGLQYVSDSSSNRVKQFRERQRNVSETTSESETEADTESKKDNSTAKRGADKRGTRLPEDWKLSAEDRAFAADLGLDPDVTADEFRDYWTALPGARGRKLDWSKTFRNRCREIAGRPKRGGPVRPTMQTMPADDADQWRARLRVYTPGAFWPSGWGPRPGEPGCFVPATVLAEFPQARTQ